MNFGPLEAVPSALWPRGSAPRTPGHLLCGQKVPKKPLDQWSRPLYSFGFWLRYDLIVSFSPISAVGRCRSNRWNHSLALWPSSLGSPPRRTILFDTTGPPARCGRHPLREAPQISGAGPVRPRPALRLSVPYPHLMKDIQQFAEGQGPRTPIVLAILITMAYWKFANHSNPISIIQRN